MNYHYTHLGVVPAVASPSAERRDALLARTGPAARAIMKSIKTLPRKQQVAALDRVLVKFDEGLPERVRRVSEHLHREGMAVNQAVERALALSLADASINRIKRLGRAYRQGAVVPLGYLGTTTPESTTSQEQDAGQIVAGMFQGIVCSDGLQTSITQMVGQNEGREAHDATNLGYEVAQGFAQCGAQTPTPPLPPTTPPTTSGETSLALPIAVGVGALVVVGGVVWYTGRKN